MVCCGKDTVSLDPEGRGFESVLDQVLNARERARSTMTHLMCGIYLLVLVVVGLVLPASDALTKREGANHGSSNYYVEVFHIYLYVLSLFFLFYIHVCVLRHRYRRSMPPRETTRSVTAAPTATEDPLDSPDKTALAEDGEDSFDEGDVKDTDSARVNRQEQIACVTYTGTGVSLFLRIGAIVFGAAAMIHDGFKIAHVFEKRGFSTGRRVLHGDGDGDGGGRISLSQLLQLNSVWCYGPLYLLMAVLHLIFTFFQTYFLFKSHRVVINRNRCMVRFGLIHIVATNLCVWLFTCVSETSEDYQHHQHVPHANTSKDKVANFLADLVTNSSTTLSSVADVATKQPGGPTESSLSCYTDETLARRASPYLYPCTIEYSLIAAAIVCLVYCNVGFFRRSSATTIESDDGSEVDCHKANKGLFLGLFVTILTLISISCFFVFDKSVTDHTSAYIFFGTELSLLLLALFVALFASCKLSVLRFARPFTAWKLNACLLVAALLGVVMFNTFLLVATISVVREHGVLGGLALCSAALTLLQASVQTVLTLDGMQRSSAHEEHSRRKPARTLITLLLLCNVSLWIVKTFEMRKASAFPVQINFFGALPWFVITHVCVPFIIFYRFHSAVCLCDIWLKAYQIRSKRV